MPFCGALEQYKSAGKFIFDIQKTKFKRILLRNKNKKRFDLKLSVFSVVGGYKVISVVVERKSIALQQKDLCDIVWCRNPGSQDNNGKYNFVHL